MKRLFLIIAISMSLMTIFSTSCFAWWFIYHKPSYMGKVIDSETKEPIEGAVVVATYYKYPIISGPGGGSASIMHIKEALTDKNGKFRIPSYTTVIQPLSTEDQTEFIIYKPGYGKFPHERVSPPKPMSSPAIERFFWEESFGKQGEIILNFGPLKKSYGTYGVVELPPLKTRKERLDATPSPPTDDMEKLPLLYKLINQEHKRFGLKTYKRKVK